MTLEELKAQFPPTQSSAVETVNTMSLPWWVILKSRKPNPDGSPRFKFDFGFATREEAEARRDERQRAEADATAERNLRRVTQAATEGVPADQVRQEEAIPFFVIERPKEGHL